MLFHLHLPGAVTFADDISHSSWDLHCQTLDQWKSGSWQIVEIQVRTSGNQSVTLTVPGRTGNVTWRLVRIEVLSSGLTGCKSGPVKTLLTTTLSGLYIRVMTIMRGNEEYHKERDPQACGEPCGTDK